MKKLIICYEAMAPQLLIDNVPKVLKGVLGNQDIEVKVESINDKSTKQYNLGCLILHGRQSGRPEWQLLQPKVQHLKELSKKIVVIVAGSGGDSFSPYGYYTDIKNWFKVEGINSENLTLLVYDGDPNHLNTYQHKEEVKRFIESGNLLEAEQAGSKLVEASKASAPAPKEPAATSTPKSAAAKPTATPQELSPPASKQSFAALAKAIKESQAVLKTSTDLLESAGTGKNNPKYAQVLSKFLRESQQKAIDSLKSWEVALPAINVSEQDVDTLIKNQETLVTFLEAANKTLRERFERGDYKK